MHRSSHSSCLALSSLTQSAQIGVQPGLEIVLTFFKFFSIILPVEISDGMEFPRFFRFQERTGGSDPCENSERSERTAGEIMNNNHNPETPTAMYNLAALYEKGGKYDRAESLYVECMELSKAVLGASHPDTLTTMNGLAGLY